MHDTSAKTFFLSASFPNWKIKMFSLNSSILSSFIIFHTRSKTALKHSSFTSLFSNPFPSRHPANIFSPFSFILLLMVTFPLVSPFSEIALHVLISSSVSILLFNTEYTTDRVLTHYLFPNETYPFFTDHFNKG